MTNAPKSSEQLYIGGGRLTVGILALTALILISPFLPSVFQEMLVVFVALVCILGWLLFDAVIFGVVSQLAQRLPRRAQVGSQVLFAVVAGLSLVWWWRGMK